jgi:hypothetical protein
MKVNASFYKNTLLPELFKAKSNGINIKSKSALLHYFNKSEDEKYWVCCASGEDLNNTSEIVDLMDNEKDDILLNIGISEAALENIDGHIPNEKLLKVTSSLKVKGKNKVADKIFSDLYYKNREDDLDKLELMKSEISDEEIELGLRKYLKYLV